MIEPLGPIPIVDTGGESSHDPRLSEVETWVFDLDNTLYPPSSNLFEQIDPRIGAFLQELLSLGATDARRLQKQYFREYGTTLHGLIQNHGTDPREFLDFVHDINFSRIPADPDLAKAIDRLQGRKIIFTNADVGYSNRVMERIGILGLFDGIFDIEAADFVPKPHLSTYQRMLESHDIEPKTAAIIDDLPKNLVPAAALGMTTVWMRNDHWTDSEDGLTPLAEFNHVVDHLADWLNAIG
jgi:putative hydrolase of the HAD superfamily